MQYVCCFHHSTVVDIYQYLIFTKFSLRILFFSVFCLWFHSFMPLDTLSAVKITTLIFTILQLL